MAMAEHTVASLVALAGLKPDLNPAAVHGAAKVDWVAVWLPATNWKLGKAGQPGPHNEHSEHHDLGSGPRNSLDDISDGSLDVVGRESLLMISEGPGRARSSFLVPLRCSPSSRSDRRRLSGSLRGQKRRRGGGW
jgi:hypothetical protein